MLLLHEQYTAHDKVMVLSQNSNAGVQVVGLEMCPVEWVLSFLEWKHSINLDRFIFLVVVSSMVHQNSLI